MLQYVMWLLEDEYQEERELLQVELPKVGEIPRVRFDEAKRLTMRILGRDNVRETNLFLMDVKRLEP